MSKEQIWAHYPTMLPLWEAANEAHDWEACCRFKRQYDDLWAQWDGK